MASVSVEKRFYREYEEADEGVHQALADDLASHVVLLLAMRSLVLSFLTQKRPFFTSITCTKR